MITIYRTDKGYVANYSQSPRAAEIRALFGVAVLPLPWGPNAPTIDVLTDLARHEREAFVFSPADRPAVLARPASTLPALTSERGAVRLLLLPIAALCGVVLSIVVSGVL